MKVEERAYQNISYNKSVATRLRELLHPLLLKQVSVRRNFPLFILGEHPKIKPPAIYVMNHSCMHDTPIASEVIKRHFYILVGEQKFFLRDKIFLLLNGIIWVDRKNKKSKKRACIKMKRKLQEGSSILIYPEGTWNLTPSKPLIPLYWGVIELAKATNVPIIPLATEYYANGCYISFGQAMYIPDDMDKKTGIEMLTDKLATLKWEIWNRFPVQHRNSDMASDFNKMIQQRINEYPKLDVEYELSIVRKGDSRLQNE